MKRPCYLVAFAALFVVAAVELGSTTAQDKGKGGPGGPLPPPPPKWEYKVQTIDLGENKAIEKLLNELGEEGWELCAAPTTTVNGSSGPTRGMFKRLKR